MKSQPLTDAEFERLTGVLGRFDNKHPMNLEQLDGFLAALICGPQIVRPSEYLPVICGDDIVLEDTFGAQSVLQDFLSLIMRHWSVIADTLHSGDVFLPLLLEDENGISHANDWAKGFLRGMELRKAEWAALLDDEKHGGWLVPIFALAHEHDPDPEIRPYKAAISNEEREKLIVGAAAGVTGIYRYFQKQRSVEEQPSDTATTFRRTLPKIGRNDPCPCGKNSSSAVEELHSIKTASVTPQSLCESFSPHSKVNIFNLAKNAGTSVDQIERFYARNMRIRVVGPVTVEQRRGVVSFTVSGMRSEDVCRRLDAYGLALRHGHHCAQPLMLALGIEGTARASLAPYTTEDDINHLVAALAEIVHSA